MVEKDAVDVRGVVRLMTGVGGRNGVRGRQIGWWVKDEVEREDWKERKRGGKKKLI